MNDSRCGSDRQSGISYVEVLIATVLIVISLVPMTDAVRSAITSAGAHEDAAIQHFHMIAMLEDVLAEPFSSLAAAATAAGSETVASSYSDLPGSNYRRLVFLSFYDGDNADADDDPFTGADPGLMWVRTEIESSPMAIESLLSQ